MLAHRTVHICADLLPPSHHWGHWLLWLWLFALWWDAVPLSSRYRCNFASKCDCSLWSLHWCHPLHSTISVCHTHTSLLNLTLRRLPQSKHCQSFLAMLHACMTKLRQLQRLAWRVFPIHLHKHQHRGSWSLCTCVMQESCYICLISLSGWRSGWMSLLSQDPWCPKTSWPCI